MPIYEFTCRKCGHGFEELMGMGEAAKADLECPSCGSRQVQKGFSAFATGGGATASAPAAGCGRAGFT